MEEQAPYGRHKHHRLIGQKTESSFYKGLTQIRSIGITTQNNLILDEDRKGVAVDAQNQAILEAALEKMIRITDMYFT